jgi:hypothetical protein
MKFHFKNYPHYVPPRVYEDVIQGMVERLKKQEGIISIFQMGSILHPGISDIDMLVVLKEDGAFRRNPLAGLAAAERYLFVHPLLGTSKADFMEAQQFSFYRNWRLLWGEQFSAREDELSKEEVECVQIQTALEYLISNFINLTILRIHRIVNVRALLLNMKAILYDLKLLGVSSGRLYELLEKLMEWRDQWFERRPHVKDLGRWIDECYRELGSFLKTALETHPFYLPEWGTLHITKNVTLIPAEHFFCKHRGIILPVFLGFLGKKYFKIQRRLNKVSLHLPVQKGEVPPILVRRFDLEYRMVQFNLDKPFLTLRSTLNFLRKIHSRRT